ncbi:MAG: sulfotransferase family 2 domain-containing protein [Bacteroidales bacterium]|nr:sulfotransferase family 2 domain-containing protein [Bacteroidales bacterium]
MNLLRKSDKIANNIELISLHIPKTAGTSFRNILKEVYGSSHVARLDIRKNIELNGKIYKGSKLKTGVRVIHGHFSFQNLSEYFEISEGTPVITWFRDPAERVVSNFYYLEKILRSKMNSQQKDLNLLSKMQKTLLEYAATDVNRNRMSKFMTGTSPEDLFFIGLTDHYEEDMKELARRLNWKSYSVPKHNITGTKPIVDNETLDKIKELNLADYEIYNKILQMRKERLMSIS